MKSREREESFTPEGEREGRTLEGKEKEAFTAELSGYIEGLESATVDPDLDEEDKEELLQQLADLKDSLEAISAGGQIKEF